MIASIEAPSILCRCLAAAVAAIQKRIYPSASHPAPSIFAKAVAIGGRADADETSQLPTLRKPASAMVTAWSMISAAEARLLLPFAFGNIEGCLMTTGLRRAEWVRTRAGGAR